MKKDADPNSSLERNVSTVEGNYYEAEPSRSANESQNTSLSNAAAANDSRVNSEVSTGDYEVKIYDNSAYIRS